MRVDTNVRLDVGGSPRDVRGREEVRAAEQMHCLHKTHCVTALRDSRPNHNSLFRTATAAVAHLKERDRQECRKGTYSVLGVK